MKMMNLLHLMCHLLHHLHLWLLCRNIGSPRWFMCLKVRSVAPESGVRTRPLLSSLVLHLRFSGRTKEHQCQKNQKTQQLFRDFRKVKKKLHIFGTLMLAPTGYLIKLPKTSLFFVSVNKGFWHMGAYLLVWVHLQTGWGLCLWIEKVFIHLLLKPSAT